MLKKVRSQGFIANEETLDHGNSRIIACPWKNNDLLQDKPLFRERKTYLFISHLSVLLVDFEDSSAQFRLIFVHQSLRGRTLLNGNLLFTLMNSIYITGRNKIVCSPYSTDRNNASILCLFVPKVTNGHKLPDQTDKHVPISL